MKNMVLLLLLLANMLFAGDKIYGNAFVERVTSIYDGDTFRVDIKQYPEIIGKRIPVRVADVDTPEMRGECKKEKELARQAKQFTVEVLRGAKTIELRNMRRGKYFRIVADVYVNNNSLSRLLIKNGLGVAYYGGKKQHDWCR